MNPWESIGIELYIGIQMEFQWIPFLGAPGFRPIPLDSIGIFMEWTAKMAEAPANWILLEFHGIPTFQIQQFPPQLMESKDLHSIPFHVLVHVNFLEFPRNLYDKSMYYSI